MTFEKSNGIDLTAQRAGWCTCSSCDNSNPHENYNQRSGPENPQQNS